jgi:protein phosphatase PTC6
MPRSLREKELGEDGNGGTRQVFQFSVFDGHGGSECAEFLQENLARYIETVNMGSGQALQEAYRKQIGGYWRAWRHEIERYIAQLTPWDDLQLRIPLAYLTADFDYIMSKKKAGSTCTSVFLYTEQEGQAFWDPGQTTHLVTGHVGDTRCIVGDNKGNATALTINHHPSSAVEAGRLRRYAASFFTDSFGEERYYQYANTRAFGDRRAKARGVTAEPEVTECRVGVSNGRQEPRNVHVLSPDEAFLVLVSDGVSSMMSDQEIVDLVIYTANSSGSGRGTPQDAASELVEFAAAVGGDDNATALVVRLPGWGAWDDWMDRTGQLREDRLREVAEAPERRRR